MDPRRWDRSSFLVSGTHALVAKMKKAFQRIIIDPSIPMSFNHWTACSRGPLLHMQCVCSTHLLGQRLAPGWGVGEGGLVAQQVSVRLAGDAGPLVGAGVGHLRAVHTQVVCRHAGQVGPQLPVGALRFSLYPLQLKKDTWWISGWHNGRTDRWTESIQRKGQRRRKKGRLKK